VLTDGMVAEISACGGFMLIVVGLGLLGATRARVANLLPGLILTPLIVLALDCAGDRLGVVRGATQSEHTA